MKLFVICALAGAAVLSQAQTIFYGGDPDGRNGLVSGYNLFSAGEAMTFDDFNIGNATITSIFGDWFVNPVDLTSSFTTANYQIRSGITDTNSGGTLVASGTVAITAVNTGLTGFGLSIYRMTTAAINVPLAAGTYWVTMEPKGDGANSIYVTTANGTVGIGSQAGIGTPLANGNSYFDAVSVYGPAGWSRTDNGSVLGAGTWDFSYGINASAAPEPASMAILGIGAMALIRRRRNKKA